MNKLIILIASIWIVAFIAGAIAGGDLIADPIKTDDIKQTPVTIDIVADVDSTINDVFTGVVISAVDSNGRFSIYKDGVINREKQIDVNGKTKLEIETEVAEIAREELEVIKPLFETKIQTPATYLTDEQIVNVNKIATPIIEEPIVEVAP